jgi:GNAT superfamily N-acetyltransferase
MRREDVARIKEVLKTDKKYQHFGIRVEKDYKNSLDQGLPVGMQVFYAQEQGIDIGFVVISISPLKMREWEEVFVEEGWVEADFKIGVASFELMYLYVKEGFRNKGLGSKLFFRVRNYADKMGIRSIYAYVSDTTDQAMQFYLKEGGRVISNFSEAGNTTAFFVWDGVPEDNYEKESGK